MIRRLRIKFITVTLGVLLIVFLTVFAAINLSMYQNSIRQTERMLDMIVEQDGITLPFGNSSGIKPPSNSGFHEDFSGTDRPFPFFGGAENEGANKTGTFFYAKTDKQYKMTESFYDMILDFSEEDIAYYLNIAVSYGEQRGSIGHLEYLIGEKDYGYIIVFAERSIETGMLGSLMNISVIVAAVSCLILAVFVFFLSKWIVRPVEDAFQKQRRFISDASHELKTPLTIISANADVLENEVGENIRIAHIKNQTERMGLLVHDLLDLTRTDENPDRSIFAVFDLSQAVLGTTLEFESRAFEEGRELQYDIQEGVFYRGNEGKIRQLTAILIDNAVKHSEDHGIIDIMLKKSGQKITLSVRNTGVGITEEEREKVFERFYRSDASRSRETGGYGLGLAIAKSITDLHKGKISIQGEEGKHITFSVQLI